MQVSAKMQLVTTKCRWLPKSRWYQKMWGDCKKC